MFIAYKIIKKNKSKPTKTNQFEAVVRSIIFFYLIEISFELCVAKNL